MKKTLFVLAGLLISTIAASAANLLSDDASLFDNGSWGAWDVYGNKASKEIATPGYNGSEGCFKLTNPTNALLISAQAAYELDQPLTAGTDYAVKFYAKASKAGAKLGVSLQNHTTLHEVNYSPSFTLTEDWQLYQATFPVEDEDLTKVLFSFGEDAADFYIDYVKVSVDAAILFPETIVEAETDLANWTRTFTGSGTDGTFVLNTWSTEADASEVRTPFIETWVWGGGGAQLSPMQIKHAALTGLEAGKYEVYITARAYNEMAGSDTPSGVKFVANDGEVDLSEGQTFTFNNMAGIWDNFVIPATVGADGTLNVTIDIYNANLSWFAFKNFKVVYLKDKAPEVELPVGKMSAKNSKALLSAMAAFEAWNDRDSYDALLAAVAAAEASVEFYAPYEAAIDALDEAGAAALDADVLQKFNDGEYEASDAAELNEALAAAQKAQTTPGSSLSFAGSTDKADWVGATGNYQNIYVERYGDACQPGKILYQVIDGLVPGAKYEVQFLATANMAWIGAATGADIAQIYANDKAYDIEVIGQVSCNPTDYLRTIVAKADEEGKLEFGLQNIGVGGNWYVAQFVDLTYMAGPYPIFAEGDYYLQNAETGTWFGGANSWGTQASLIKHANMEVNLTLQDGKYSLDTHTYNSAAQHFLGSNGYVDANETFWTIEELEDGLYTLNVDGAYLQYDGASNVLQVTADADPTSAAAQWYIVSKEDLLAELTYETAPADATFLLKAADFSRNHHNPNFDAVWTAEAANYNISGGNNLNNNAESWRSSNGFNVYQTLTDIPNGQYILNAQATVCDYDQTFEDLPVVYANEQTSDFFLSSQTSTQDGGENSMSAMSESFTNGLYAIQPIKVVVEDGTLTIGVKSTRTSVWAVWDNFELTYMGEPAPEFAVEEASEIGDYYEGYPVGIEGDDALALVTYLGVTDPSEITIATVAPDGSYVTANNGRGDTDGWRNAEGAFTTWGTEGCTYYVQPYAELEDGEYYFGAYMGSYPGAVTEPVTYSAPVIFQANGKEVVVTCGLEYVYMYYADATSYIGDYYEGIAVGVSEDDAAAIAAYLGVESAEEITIAALANDGTLVTDNNGRGATDGWRNAEGEFASWGSEGCTFYSQPYATLEDGVYSFGAYMGSFPDAVTEETEYPTVLVFSANDKEVYVTTTLAYEQNTDFWFYPECGDESLSAEWWTTWSDSYGIAAGQTAHFNFYNYSSKVQTWDNWVLIAANCGDNAHGTADNPEYAEYFALRSDNFGWGNNYDGTTLVNDYDWNTFKEDMDGSYVDMAASFDGTKVSVTAVITTKDNKTYNYSFSSSEFAAQDSVYFFFTTEQGMMTTDKYLKISVVEEVDVDLAYAYTKGYDGLSVEYDADAVEDAIGCAAEDAIIYAWNPTTSKYELNAMSEYDGWHNADGDCDYWGTPAAFCVKFYTDGTIWACTRSDVAVAGTPYTCYWLLVNPETGEAVQYVCKMTDANSTTGIDAIANAKANDAKIFDLTGRQVNNVTKGGIYIVNGKKVVLK